MEHDGGWTYVEPAVTTGTDITKFMGGWTNVNSTSGPLIATSSVPNVIWQNTSSNATYASASNIITPEGKTLKRTGAVYT